ncbi:MAG: type II toxin-antitoxin system RelB/DinJ family antitoxin [Kiritimatiellae bacterium]|nr:type II toxin-antitoxin system RelB/DinJ family antitoxin [Kiritimatiellia bacterium]
MTTTITARVDSAKKREAEAIFNDIGMTLSGAINVFINEVVMCQGIPFSLRRRPPADRSLEAIMDETDAYCLAHRERLTHSQVFGHAREIANAGRSVHA